jgi:hypothetical protein
MLITHNIPEGAKVSELYDITACGIKVDAYFCRVSAMPFHNGGAVTRSLAHTEEAAFIYFDMDEPVSLTVKSSVKSVMIEDAVVRPLSKGVHPEVENDIIRFTIEKAGQYTLEINGHHSALHIFANPVEDFGVDKSSKDVIYFGPGVHHPGIIKPESGQTIFVDTGAVVHCKLLAREKNNICVLGRGIMTAETFNASVPRCAEDSLMLFDRCQNIDIRGIIYNDTEWWTGTFIKCNNVNADNIKAVGMWRYNSDGFDFCNSSNCYLKNSFLRNFDDGVVLKGLIHNGPRVENIIISGCVIWCDWGRALEIGAETTTEEYRNILFTDCDVIHTDFAAMDLHNAGGGNVHGLLFDDIRVEYSKYATPGEFQPDKSRPYSPDLSVPHTPFLIFGTIYAMYDGPYLGETHDVVFKNISVYVDESVPIPPCEFNGFDEEHQTYDILIDGLYINGEKITDMDKANIKIGNYAKNIRLA